MNTLLTTAMMTNTKLIERYATAKHDLKLVSIIFGTRSQEYYDATTPMLEYQMEIERRGLAAGVIQYANVWD